MANVLISYYKIQEIPLEQTLCFWDGLSKELKACGNNVLQFNCANCNTYNSNDSFNKNVANYCLEKAKKFKPDLIIAFNNRIPKIILDYFNNIPVLMWDGDDPSYICDIDYIKKNIDRYEILSIVPDWRNDYIKMGIPDEKIHYLPVATAITAEKTEKLYNISFLGVAHYYHQNFTKLINSSNSRYILKQNIYDFLNNPNYDFEANYKKYSNNGKVNIQSLYPIYDYRWLTLGNMLDLGLTIVDSTKRWNGIMPYAPQIPAMMDDKIVWTLDDNNNFYNSTKVSLSVQHPQGRGSGFSWRCFDVMASDSCLLSTTSSELRNLIKKYVNLPMYDTPYQARELAIKLLKDDIWRNDLIQASNSYINENARWIHRFRKIEDLTKIKLIDESKSENSTLVELKEIFKIAKKDKLSRKYKIYYKVVEWLLKKQYLNKFEYKTFRHYIESLRKRGVVFDDDKVKSVIDNYEKNKYKTKYEKEYKKRINKLRQNIKRGKKIRVVFSVVFDSVFPMEPLFREMLSDNIFEPVILIIPDTQRGRENMFFQMKKAYDTMLSRYPNSVICSYDYDNNKFIDYTEKTDIICPANIYDNMTHEYYGINYHYKQGCLPIYTSYYYMGKTNYDKNVFSLKEYMLLWKLFVETPHIIDNMKKNHFQRLIQKTTVTGYVKMDPIAGILPDKNRKRKRIIIAPHHSISKQSLYLNISNFLEYHEFFIELPKMYPNIDFVFRPHPLLFEKLSKPIFWGQDNVNRYIEQIKNIENMEYQEGGDYFETFQNSDGLINDCNSFLSEYFYTHKPQCFMLENEDALKREFTDFGIDIINKTYKAFSKEDIIHFIDEVIINGNDYMKNERIKYGNEHIMINYPNATKTVMEHLKKIFTN